MRRCQPAVRRTRPSGSIPRAQGAAYDAANPGFVALEGGAEAGGLAFAEAHSDLEQLDLLIRVLLSTLDGMIGEPCLDVGGDNRLRSVRKQIENPSAGRRWHLVEQGVPVVFHQLPDPGPVLTASEHERDDPEGILAPNVPVENHPEQPLCSYPIGNDGCGLEVLHNLLRYLRFIRQSQESLEVVDIAVRRDDAQCGICDLGVDATLSRLDAVANTAGGSLNFLIIAEVPERRDEGAAQLPAAIVFAVRGVPSHFVCLVSNQVAHEVLQCRSYIGRRHPVEFPEAAEDLLPDIDLRLCAELADKRQILRRRASSLQDVRPGIGDNVVALLTAE